MTLSAVEYAPAPKESQMWCRVHFPPHRADWITTGKATFAICDKSFQRLREKGFARAANGHPETSA